MRSCLNIIFLLSFITLFTRCSHMPKATHYDKYTPTSMEKNKTGPVDFYSRSKPYGEFSNFAFFPIKIEGKVWPTSEHYYQAYKYTTEEMREKVRKEPDPAKAAAIGRDPKYPKRRDWHQVKEHYMWVALKAKYSQHEDLKRLLLSTGDRPIFEHTKNDCYWGDCGDRSGVNRLGSMLEDIRDMLRKGSLK